MAKISARVEQTVQISQFCHQRVAMSVTDLDAEEATDENLKALMSGPARRTFDHLSKAVLAQCDDLRTREVKRMNEETNGN